MKTLNNWTLSILIAALFSQSIIAHYLYELKQFEYQRYPMGTNWDHIASRIDQNNQGAVQINNLGAVATFIDLAKYLFKQNDAQLYPVSLEFKEAFKNRNAAIYNFIDTALKANKSLDQACLFQARLDLYHFDTSTIPIAYRNQIEAIKSDLIRSFFASDGAMLDIARNNHLGALFEPFLKDYFDYDGYMTALNMIGDKSAQAIVDFQQASPFRKGFQGVGIGIEKLQNLLNHQKEIPTLDQIKNHPHNSAAQSVIDACKNNNFERAAELIQPNNRVAQKIYEYEHKKYLAHQYNDLGILKKYETDRIWQGLSREAQETITLNPAQRKILNQILETREEFRDQLYQKYEIDRYATSPEIDVFVEDLVDLKSTLEYRMTEAIDYILEQKTNPEIFDMMCHPSGIFKDFQHDPILPQTNLLNISLKENKRAVTYTNYFLAIRDSLAPDSVKEMAAQGIRAISDSLQGKPTENSAGYIEIFNDIIRENPEMQQRPFNPNAWDAQFNELKQQLIQNSSPNQLRTEQCNTFAQEGDIKARQTGQLSPDAQQYLKEMKIDARSLESIFGNVLQRGAHKEIITNINDAASLRYNPHTKVDTEITDIVVEVSQESKVCADQNEIKKSWALNDICSSILDYAKAVGNGVWDGTERTIKNIAKDPIGFTVTTAAHYYAGSTMLAYGIAKATYQYSGIALDRLAKVNWQNLSTGKIVNTFNKITTALKERGKFFLTPAGVKEAIAFGVNWRLEANISRSLGKFFEIAGKKTQLIFEKLRDSIHNPQLVAQTADGSKITIPNGNENHLNISSDPELQNNFKQNISKINNPTTSCEYPSCSVQYEKLKRDLRINELTSVIDVTEHGLQRLIERGIKVEDLLSAISKPDFLKIQKDGLNVYIKNTAAGKYNVFIMNPNTRKLVTSMPNISYKSLLKLGKNYGWDI